MIPLVAVVGRPNVGKSTLFNRLVGKRAAIVHDSPGVTRDRHYADAHVHGRDLTLVDTGGLDATSEDPLGAGVTKLARAAIEEADVVLCVLDGTAAPTDADVAAVKLLREASKPTLWVANKVDGRAKTTDADLYRLGINPIFAISALHGTGTSALEAALVRALPPVVIEDELDGDLPRIAIIGRPNAGKSSLVNRLAKEDRTLVSETPGTTRDPIDVRIDDGERSFIVVDTAGIRRKSKVIDEIETASVLRALKAVDRADVAILLCDATEPVAEQDQRLAGLAIDRGRALVVALNKIDALDRRQRAAAMDEARRAFGFAKWVPIELVSAKSGAGVPGVVARALRAVEERKKRVPTAALNRFFEQVLDRRPPPTSGGKAPRIYYLTQARTDPPLFIAMASAPDAVKESYRRFVLNEIRKQFGFEAVPIALTLRDRRRRRE